MYCSNLDELMSVLQLSQFAVEGQSPILEHVGIK